MPSRLPCPFNRKDCFCNKTSFRGEAFCLALSKVKFKTTTCPFYKNKEKCERENEVIKQDIRERRPDLFELYYIENVTGGGSK